MNSTIPVSTAPSLGAAAIQRPSTDSFCRGHGYPPPVNSSPQSPAGAPGSPPLAPLHWLPPLAPPTGSPARHPGDDLQEWSSFACTKR